MSCEIPKILRPRLGLLGALLLDGPPRALSSERYSTGPDSAMRDVVLSGVAGASGVVGAVRPLLLLPMLLVRVASPPPPMLLVLPLPGVS